MNIYADFIKQNVAVENATKISIINRLGKSVGTINLGGLTRPSTGNKLYSFGAISDVHINHSTAKDDFQRALTFFNEEHKVDFICICGDLISGNTSNPQTTELEQYKSYVDTYSPNTPVYAIAGNHEAWGTLAVADIIEEHTGKPLYYSLGIDTKGECIASDVNKTAKAYGDSVNSVFIMLGIKQDSPSNLFADGELQWFYETLEANRNKRCFVFQHVRPDDVCGNAYGIYNYDIWAGTEKTVFESLISHYHNVILFHGHSHLKFSLQTKDNMANIDKIFGCWSVHIPSIAVPRTGDVTGANSREELYAESEGYVIDVYRNHIVLRGRDFITGQFLPIATYCLDTTLQTVEAGTYTDSTGTITT